MPNNISANTILLKGTVCRSSGYRLIYYKRILYKEHRLIWELTYGEIPKGYIIHHKNQIVSDNELCNLQAMSKSDHVLLHNSLKPKRHYYPIPTIFT